MTIDEIKKFIENDSSSNKKRRAKVGQRYYEGKHDIRDYQMYYYNDKDELVKDTTRSNIKISHPFQTELVDQLVQYILSGDEPYMTSKNEALQKILDDNFNNNDNFNAELEEVLTGSSSKGFEYMYAYTNEDGELAFQCADSLKVVEVEGKYTSDGKDYVIYYYNEHINQDNKVVKRIQVWDDEKVTYYTQIENGAITLDAVDKKKGKLNPAPHVKYKKANDDTTYYEGLGFIPFFRLDYNRKQLSSLEPIKELIDDYDLMSCGLSNNIQDASEYLVLIKGYNGDDLDEVITNVKTKKVMAVDEEGDLEQKTIEIPYQARQAKLELDEKNIYRFGMGFNSAQIGDGNITNIVIKSRYALLDLKANKFEKKIKQFLKKIVKVVLDAINEKEKTAYSIKDVKISFKREIMTNASDNVQIEKTEAEIKQILINVILTLRGILDNETIIRKLCDTLEIDYDDIKIKLPVSPEDEIDQVQKTLDEPIDESIKDDDIVE